MNAWWWRVAVIWAIVTAVVVAVAYLRKSRLRKRQGDVIREKIRDGEPRSPL